MGGCRTKNNKHPLLILPPYCTVLLSKLCLRSHMPEFSSASSVLMTTYNMVPYFLQRWGGVVTHHIPVLCRRSWSVLERTPPRVEVQGCKAWKLGLNIPQLPYAPFFYQKDEHRENFPCHCGNTADHPADSSNTVFPKTNRLQCRHTSLIKKRHL